jgi:hypothetical protein
VHLEAPILVDGQRAARKSNLHMAATKLISNKDTGNQDYLLRDYIAETWSMIDYMLAKNLEYNAKPEFTIFSRQCKIQGYEFLSLVHPEPTITKREITIKSDHGGWLSILEKTSALVLFADNFGELIKPVATFGPSNQSRLCTKYITLPRARTS